MSFLSKALCSSTSVGLLIPCLLYFYCIMKATFDLSISVIGPALGSTHGSGTVDVHLIPTPRDDEVHNLPVSVTRTVKVVLRSSFGLNMVFVTISSNSEYSASRSSPFQLHFQIPCLPTTKGHLLFSLSIFALHSPISSSLSARGMPLSTLAS